MVIHYQTIDKKANYKYIYSRFINEYGTFFELRGLIIHIKYLDFDSKDIFSSFFVNYHKLNRDFFVQGLFLGSFISKRQFDRLIKK